MSFFLSKSHDKELSDKEDDISLRKGHCSFLFMLIQFFVNNQWVHALCLKWLENPSSHGCFQVRWKILFAGFELKREEIIAKPGSIFIV